MHAIANDISYKSLVFPDLHAVKCPVERKGLTITNKKAQN